MATTIPYIVELIITYFLLFFFCTRSKYTITKKLMIYSKFSPNKSFVIASTMILTAAKKT